MRIRIVTILIAIMFCISEITAQQAETLKGSSIGQKPPGLIPEVFAPGVISTDNVSEFSCCISPDGNEFYFARATENIQFTIYLSRKVNGSWGEPELASFSGKYFNHEPYITNDAKQIFWGSKRPLPDGTTKYAIWTAKREENEWGVPYPLGFKAMYITMSRNGTVYYTGTGRGGACLSRAIPDGQGGYIHEILPEPLLSDYWDGHPCIAPDESFIIFDSENRPGQEECGLFISFRRENGGWTEPENMNKVISKGRYAMLSPDGKYLFFSAPGNGSGKDIYWVSSKVIENFRTISR